MQRELKVFGFAPNIKLQEGDGEWKGLEYAAYLLSQRFGERGRPYLVHVAKSMSVPLMQEMQTMFLDELVETSESIFRGLRNEVQSSFLSTHFIMERHREALYVVLLY